jgi:hypothetical protein
MALLTRLSWLGLAKETTQGTAVNPSLYVPVMAPKTEDVVTTLDDDSLANSATKIRGVYQGIKDGTFDYDMLVYPEAVGLHAIAAGLVDTTAVYRTVADGVTTITSTAITSATAAFTQADVGATIAGSANIPAGTVIASVTSGTAAVLSQNATASSTAQTFNIGGTVGQSRHRLALASSGAQPSSLTLTDFDVFETRQYPGGVLDQFDLTVDAKAVVKLAAKWKTWPSAVSGTGTYAGPASVPYLGWQVYAFVNGAAANRIVSAAFTFKRNTEAIHTLSGSQGPQTVFATEAEASVKMKALFNDDTDLNYLLNNTQPAIQLSLVGNGGTTLTVTMSKAAFKKAPIDRSGKYLQIDIDADGVLNTSDAGPMALTLQDTHSAAY